MRNVAGARPFRTNDGKKIGTDRSFDLRAVVETTNFVSKDFEPCGVKTMFPLYGPTDGSDLVPQWFNMESGTLRVAQF